ncbi:gamma-glutamylcysteine synthetase [Castilleja foliolosa]|uniref:Gamma-glutamylcysteine synthetase n=1 Tax=Castilleja foliolosa TaxID=1961234 RepID=A0ABD3BF52_9LAMI
MNIKELGTDEDGTDEEQVNKIHELNVTDEEELIKINELNVTDEEELIKMNELNVTDEEILIKMNELNVTDEEELIKMNELNVTDEEEPNKIIETNTAENENLSLVISVSKKKTFADIPEQLQEQILTYLPVKNLVVFECVAKRWLNSFKNPQFILEQFNRSNPPPMLLVQDNWPYHVERYSFFSIKRGNPSTVNTVFPIPDADAVGRLRLVGSAEGVICVAQLQHPQSFTLFNPATRKVLTVPAPPSPLQNLVGDSSIGFGYNHTTKVFVLVRFFIYLGKYDVGNYSAAQSYDFEEEVWSYVNDGSDLCFLPINDVSDVVINGIPYWRVVNPNLKLYQMASYDPDTSAITLESFKWEKNLESFFGELIEGFLCAVVRGKGGTFDFWCRESVGEWKELYKLDFAGYPKDLMDGWCPFLGLTWDETIVIQYAGRVYISKLDKLDTVECIDRGWDPVIRLLSYRETLTILPKGYRSFGSGV